MRVGTLSPWLVKALLVGSILLAGCTGTDEERPDVEVLLEPPEGDLEAGATATFTVRLEGDIVEATRVGIAWADTSTDSISRQILVLDVFDDAVWSNQRPASDGSAHVVLESLPSERWLHVRAMVETPQGLFWSPESRLTIQQPGPPLELDFTFEGLPQTTYAFNRHNVALNITGANESADEVGFAWSTRPMQPRDETGLRPAHFDGHRVLEERPVVLPGEYRFERWEVPANESLYLRAWSVVDGQYHWGPLVTLGSDEPPIYDHQQATAGHTVEIKSSGLPLPMLASFDPQEIHMQLGESIRWVNQDAHFHTASHAANESGFHTGSLAPGAASLDYRFLVPGTYEVECRMHPQTMRATLIVAP